MYAPSTNRLCYAKTKASPPFPLPSIFIQYPNQTIKNPPTMQLMAPSRASNCPSLKAAPDAESETFEIFGEADASAAATIRPTELTGLSATAVGDDRAASAVSEVIKKPWSL